MTGLLDDLRAPEPPVFSMERREKPEDNAAAEPEDGLQRRDEKRFDANHADL
jgi:hypothetical protein